MAKDKEKEKKKPGRPPRFNSVEEMEEIIKKYFEGCEPKALKDENGEVIYDKKGNITIIQKPPTMSDLCLELGFTSQQSFTDYRKKSIEYSECLTRARTMVQAYNERRLYDRDGVNGAKTWLEAHADDYKSKGIDPGDLEITIKVVK